MTLAYLAYAVGPSERLDARLLGKLAAHGQTTAGDLADGLARLADPLPLLVLLACACAVAFWRGRPRQALAAVAVVAGANVTTQILKVLLARLARNWPNKDTNCQEKSWNGARFRNCARPIPKRCRAT